MIFKYDCDILTDGADALVHSFMYKYELIITSIFNKGVDGVQLINAGKSSNTINSLTPIIVLTSDENISEMFDIERLPDFVIKKEPESVTTISNILKEIEVSTDSNIRYRFLSVEDDKFIQKCVTLWLKKHEDIEMDIASSLEDLNSYLENDYDLIVSDNLLGDGEAIDVIHKIQGSALKDKPILIYTGTVEKVDLKIHGDAGNLQGVLAKPFEMNSFLKILKSIKHRS